MKLIDFFIGRVKSFLPAFQGILYAVKHEKNIWFHGLATLAALIFIFILKLNYIEILFFISAITIVWVSELFNTAIEQLLNFIHPDKNHHVKNIKDLSAAGVFLAAVYAIIVFFVILFIKIY